MNSSKQFSMLLIFSIQKIKQKGGDDMFFFFEEEAREALAQKGIKIEDILKDVLEDVLEDVSDSE